VEENTPVVDGGHCPLVVRFDLVVAQPARRSISEISLPLSPDLRNGKQFLLCLGSMRAHGRFVGDFELGVVLITPTRPPVNAPRGEVQV